MRKKSLSILLAVCIVVSLLPTTALATELSWPVGAEGNVSNVTGTWGRLRSGLVTYHFASGI